LHLLVLAAYDSDTTRITLAERDLQGQIARKGIPAPIQATPRWPVERTLAWGNQFGKLRWCTERNTPVVEFWLALAHAIITLGRLIRQAWTCYRWDGRPRHRPWEPPYWRSLLRGCASRGSWNMAGGEVCMYCVSGWLRVAVMS
jgi:hypothetical protein